MMKLIDRIFTKVYILFIDHFLLGKNFEKTLFFNIIPTDDNGNLVYDCRCGGHFRIIDSYCPSQSTSSSQSMIIIDCDCCSLSVRLID